MSFKVPHDGLVKSFVKVTIVCAVSPWDDLVHFAELTLMSDRAGSIVQAVVLRCHRVEELAALPAAGFRVGDDHPVTCIQCIARSCDAD